jgi:hypothetical protein
MQYPSFEMDKRFVQTARVKIRACANISNFFLFFFNTQLILDEI